MGEIPMPNYDNYILPGTNRRPVMDAFSELGQALRSNLPNTCFISSLAFLCGREIAAEARSLPLEQLTVNNLVNSYLPSLPGSDRPRRVFLDTSEAQENLRIAMSNKFAYDRLNRILAPGIMSIVYSDFNEVLSDAEIRSRLNPAGSQVSDLAKSFTSHVVGAMQLPDKMGTFLTWDTSRNSPQEFAKMLTTRQVVDWIKDFPTVERWGQKVPVPMSKVYIVPFNFLQ